MLDSLLAKVRDEFPDELLAGALPARLGADVEEADVTQAGAELSLREPDHLAVRVGDDDAAFPEIRVGQRRRRERPRPVLVQVGGDELLEHGEIRLRGLASRHCDASSSSSAATDGRSLARATHSER